MTRPAVTVVGLGPGDPTLVTVETHEAIEQAGARLVRTADHPAVATLLADAIDLAESVGADAAAIAETVVAAAAAHGAVLYAVPGSPVVREPSVELLRSDERIDCRVLRALPAVETTAEAADDVAAGYVRFHQLARTLREECPWDREQTHASLVPYLVEETFELVDALQALDPDDPATEQAVIEELGDVLYQIEFHVTLAEQAGRWTIADVTRGIHDKLVRRHPHVFGDTDAADAGAVLRNWDDIKRAEKSRTSVFDGVARSLPSLAYLDQLMRKAAKVGFEWPGIQGPFAKLDEELDELRVAITDGDAASVTDEVGDLLATVVSIARHLGVDPELAARGAAHKFRRRFEAVEALAAERGVDLRSAGLDALDALWDEIKTAR